MSRTLDKEKEEEFYQRIEELKQYYAAQGPGSKHDPDKNTALSFFVNVHRGMRLLPTGIPAWKAQALESIDGWSWTSLPTKSEQERSKVPSAAAAGAAAATPVAVEIGGAAGK